VTLAYHINFIMNHIKIDIKFQKQLQLLLEAYPLVYTIACAIDKSGGKSLLVGGAVRDLFLNKPIKDLDIEVYHLSMAQLENLLKKFGQVSMIGQAFGVLRVHGLDVDWSIPREDTAGRKPQVHTDPFMTFKKAFSRRDLTINAMGIDIISYELIDPFNGLYDLAHSILRTPDKKRFVEDPLRFYRVMQFIARFEMYPDQELNDICQTMDISAVSRERIEEEYKKWLLKSSKPSLALCWLKTINRLIKIFPEIAALCNIPQNPVWHPEGTAYEHTLQAVDAAAQLSYSSDKEKLILMYAALCHDLGKATTTEKRDNQWTSYGHERESVRLTKKLLKRITNNKELTITICILVRYHMRPSVLVSSNASLSAYKRLAKKMSPYVTLSMLGKLALADLRGRNPKKGEPLGIHIEVIETFLKRAAEAEVLKKIERPVLLGRDLLDVMQPGPQMGIALKRAYEIQLEEGIQDKEMLKKRVLKTTA